MDTACWLWTGSVRGDGYGHMKDEAPSKQMLGVHRVAWELVHGAIQDETSSHHGVCVLHRCDNRLCVNAEHLFLGSQADNLKDKISKGRDGSPRGETHVRAKLTEDQVRDIRRLLTVGEKRSDLAARFGVSERAIYSIDVRKNWKHVA